MSILAKLVSPDGTVTSVEIEHEDPSDQALIDALGGGEDIFEIGSVGDWEVLRVSHGGDDLLVIGKAPSIGSFEKRRKSCDLNDEQARQIANGLQQLNSSLGF